VFVSSDEPVRPYGDARLRPTLHAPRHSQNATPRADQIKAIQAVMARRNRTAKNQGAFYAQLGVLDQLRKDVAVPGEVMGQSGFK
jgi:hypothetical protein